MRRFVQRSGLAVLALLLASSAVGREQADDFWAERDAVLEESDSRRRIRVGIWDSGVDTALFAGQLGRDAAGAVLVRGYDAFKRRQDSPMARLPSSLAGRGDELSAILRALDDRDAGVDSPAARDIAARMKQQTPEEAQAFDDAVGRWSGYVHGTAVADIALAGNPHAELVIARMEWWHGSPPVPCWSRELAGREAESMRDLLAFLVDSGARVVNLSWGRAERAYLHNLEQCAAQVPEPERRELARYSVERVREALQQGMRSAPGVLFVGAAGNAGVDVEAANPATRFTLPNFLLVGAVDRNGKVTDWTNTGAEVRLYANGDRVRARMPDGAPSYPSGTSMAAPLVVNAALKVLAVNPRLEGAALANLLRDTATPNEAGLRLLHPRRAVEAARTAARAIPSTAAGGHVPD